MKRLVIVIAAFVALAAGSAAAYTLVDNWNATQVAGGGIYGYPANYAVKYIPAAAYSCAKIEFWGAGSDYFTDDTITVRVETDVLDQPSGEVLAQIQTPVVDGDAYWMGSDFLVPVALEAGVTYWVVFLPMAWSQIAWADAGDDFQTMSSGDAVHWNTTTPKKWMARFWGDPVVTAEARTWSEIKTLFQ
jgi:hypothetical protein